MMMLLFCSGLSRLNGGEETFLLVTAALANLTFMSPMAAAAMRQYRTAQALVNVVRASFTTTTLFSKDQVSIKKLEVSLRYLVIGIEFELRVTS
jgi:hypothetical protein